MTPNYCPADPGFMGANYPAPVQLAIGAFLVLAFGFFILARPTIEKALDAKIFSDAQVIGCSVFMFAMMFFALVGWMQLAGEMFGWKC